MTPKTIQIYLPKGDPAGIRIAEITTRIVQVLDVPRSLLKDFLEMHESKQVALYFLLGESEDGDSDIKLYIGQTGNLATRLLKHNREKEFWTRALVLVSRTNSLTQTHSLFLEWYALQAARKAGRFILQNGTSGSQPYTPKPMEADCLEIFETGRILLGTLGYPIFDPIVPPSTSLLRNSFLFCNAKSFVGRGLFTPAGFVVLKGSEGCLANTPSISPALVRFRQALLDSGVMRADGDKVVFEKDQLFKSPSMAAVALLGRNANGWTTWKNEKGETLDKIER